MTQHGIQHWGWKTQITGEPFWTYMNPWNCPQDDTKHQDFTDYLRPSNMDLFSLRLNIYIYIYI